MVTGEAYRAAFLHFVDAVPTPISIDDHPSLMLRVSAVPPSALSLILLAIAGTFWASVKILAEHCVDPVYPYLPTTYSPFNLLSLRLVALEVTVPDFTLNIAPGDVPAVKSLAVEVRIFQS